MRKLIHTPGKWPATPVPVPMGADPVNTVIIDLLTSNKLFVVIPKNLPLVDRHMGKLGKTFDTEAGTITVNGYMLDMFDSNVFFALVALCRRFESPILSMTFNTLCRIMGKQSSAPLYKRIMVSLDSMRQTGFSVRNTKGMITRTDNLLTHASIKGGELRVIMNPVLITDYAGRYINMNNHMRVN